MDISPSNNGSQKDVRQLLEENQLLLRRILENTEKTRRHIFWQRMVGLVYLVLILAPIIFAVIYLPPLLGNAIAPYKELLSSPSNKNDVNQGLLDEVQKYLK